MQTGRRLPFVASPSPLARLPLARPTVARLPAAQKRRLQPRTARAPVALSGLWHTRPAHALLAALPLFALCGCGAGSYGSSSGATTASVTKTSTSAPVAATPGFEGASTVQGTNDVVVATSSVAGTVAVVAGAAGTVSVVFNSNDGRLITGFGISGSLGNLPSGWSGPAGFACGAVGLGSACVLNLTYAPSAGSGSADSGTLTLNYVYVDNAGESKTGDTISIPYTSTTANNVMAMASPTGQIDAVAGAGSQSVTVAFTTDDGNAATNLTLTTDLTALPSGWSSAAAGLSCAIVSTGNGCALTLRYAPTTATGGTLRLSYGYTDESGAAKTGIVNIPYATAAGNTLVATASPAGQIIAAQLGGVQSVPVAFTTDDGKPATRVFVTSDLKTMPAGWSSASANFSCAAAGSGNGCQLMLRYAPLALGGGTFALDYAYTDGAGDARTGVLNVAYTATTDDNVAGTASPAGPIAAVVSDGSRSGSGTQPVTITFATDDGQPATALTLTSDLAALPLGWHSTAPGPFACAAIDPDNVCSLSLTYAPSAPGAGSLVLNYAYRNNAGSSKTGSVTLGYRATENDNVQWTASPFPTAARTGSTNPLTITFQTDDGNPASALLLTSPLTSLPAGWSSPTTGVGCATVSAGTPCTLSLTYAPTVAGGPGTLALTYSYVNDAGNAGAGTVTLPYAAFTPYLYVVNTSANTVSACGLQTDGTLAPCSVAAGGFTAPTAIAVSGNYAYITNTGSVSRCALGGNGGLTNCTPTGGPFNQPTAITIDAGGGFAYINDGTGLTLCAVGATDGALGGCAGTGAAYDPLAGIALTADGHAFSVAGDGLDTCTILGDGSGALGGCAAAPAVIPLATAALAIHDNTVYLRALTGLYACPINTGHSVSSCTATAAGIGVGVGGLTFSGSAAAGNSTAYVSSGGASLLMCPVNADGSLAACTTLRDPTFAGTAGMALRPQ